MNATSNAAAGRKPKLTALPLLVILLAIAYGMLAKLVIEQDRMIDAQRSLIRLLSDDNVALSYLHKHTSVLPKKSAGNDIEIEFENPVARNSKSKGSSAQNRSDQVELNQFPSAQVQTNQVQTNQVQTSRVPSTKTGPQANTKTDRKARRKSVPPPAELTDPSDQRRVLFSI
ncbi:MAG TPA: hypothetical protein VLW06_10515 [Terriglobales bacterium]|nr:hypothetical protein [Terriglobales bacterium]